MSSDFELFALHERWDLLDGCVALLNSEWKRSPEARAHSLRKCSEKFPISLVMIQRPFEHSVKCLPAVVGHARLTFIIGKSGACFLESVVVDKSKRRKGLGRILMAETERFAKSRGYREFFLATHDAQEFYKALGYVYCSPIMTTGSAYNLLQSTPAGGLLEKMSLTNSVNTDPLFHKTSSPVVEEDCPVERESLESNRPEVSKPSAPPPPPPPPSLTKPSSCRPVIEHHASVTVYWMTKTL
ncbi:putative N-acetyltransferase 6 [Hypsibius exemplaris]|uniref:N-acetyltransferase 6 n=1 Tax=Hypsibius exemplaris TaxID=2072580 RepID=A0A1W0X436_HYPEX|nr:putative N-acetyltransferase 6 [Hypsibius exemplaris]